MSNILVKNIIRFVLLVLFQVLVLNHMNLGGYINPSVYILFILLLPVQMNKSLVLLLAFLTGATIDVFVNTLGLHMSATVFMAYLRPSVINLFMKNSDFTGNEEPLPSKTGMGSFLQYLVTLVFLHHAVLFFLEVFSFNNFLSTLTTVILSTLVTSLMIMIVVLFFTRRKS